jgi:hypothetical protein
VIVKLGEGHIGGNEWGCKVTKLTDTALGNARTATAESRNSGMSL